MALQTVLLVEDDISMLFLLQTLLEMEGYRVHVLDGNMDMGLALERVANTRPDLVLIDVHLRRLNGLDLVKHIRQDVRLAPIRVLMTSGMPMKEECYQAGADGFILKPFMPDELVGKIRSLLPVNG